MTKNQKLTNSQKMSNLKNMTGSSLVMFLAFSTPSSTGSPCVSHPAFLFTWYPSMVLNLQKRSLMVRAITWCIPGIPFADGGPSLNTNDGLPSLVSTLFSKILCSFQSLLISLLTSERSRFLYSGNFLLIQNLI